MRVVVRQQRSIIGWTGGKGKLVGRMVPMIPPHEIYVEPFLGRGDVYRSKKTASKKEILSDKDCKRVALARSWSCKKKDSKQCDRFQKAIVSCGRDWKALLKYDSASTMFYLDPPYETATKAAQNYKYGAAHVSLREMLERVRKLRGIVLISYKNTPEFRKQLCRRPFHCTMVKKHNFGTTWSELLAIKK